MTRSDAVVTGIVVLAIAMVTLAFGTMANYPLDSRGPLPQGNVRWYTSDGVYRAVDERGVPDGCTIDSMFVISTGNMFIVPGGMSAKRAKARPFDRHITGKLDDGGWTIWSEAVLRQ